MKVPTPRRLKSGTWIVQLRLNGVSTTLTAPTKTECIRQAELLKAEYRAGKRKIEKAKKEPTLSQAIDAYIEKRKNTLSPSTITGYRRIQSGRFKDVMDLRLSELPDWQEICNRETLLCSPKTLRNAYFFIGSVLRENGIQPKQVSLPTLIPNTRQWLDPEQIRTIVSASKGSSAELPILLALHSLRRSEILALEWENIDLPNKRITVRGAVVKDENGEFVKRKANKNTSSTRTLPIMIPELYETLNAVPVSERNGAVITVSGDSVCNMINRVCRNAQLPEVGTHGLRHSFASLAYHLGLSELETMEIGGWSDTQTMHKIYTHLSAKDRLKAENKMAAFYSGADNSG